MNPEHAWQATLGELQLQMTRATFNTWLKDARFLGYEEDHGTFFVTVPSAYAKDWLENRLHTTVQRTLEGVMGKSVELRYVVWNDQSGPGRPVVDSPLLGVDAHASSGSASESAREFGSPSNLREYCLNARYTFESFVVGSNNRLAHAAALAAVENPGKSYNPLFIYGGVGLGKTHLLQAVGNACMMQGLTVLYVSSEAFTNDLVTSIRTHTTEGFRDKYRSPDVLLLDDIQFVAGKECTQEELFHTYNPLHSEDRQLVVSSDRPPRAMAQLEERLKSRFEWGLIADIQPPDLETRLAILQAKAEALNVRTGPDVLDMIAYYIRNNIRELEGALNRLVAYSQMTGSEPNVQLAEIALADLINRAPDLSVTGIIAAVADYYGLDVEDILGQSRTRKVARPRQLVMYLAREETDSSLPQIGRQLGDRDHTTVLYGCEKIEELLEVEPSLRREMLEIKARLFERVTAR
jgi:chromosomal replication initiator protein